MSQHASHMRQTKPEAAVRAVCFGVAERVSPSSAVCAYHAIRQRSQSKAWVFVQVQPKRMLSRTGEPSMQNRSNIRRLHPIVRDVAAMVDAVTDPSEPITAV